MTPPPAPRPPCRVWQQTVISTQKRAVKLPRHGATVGVTVTPSHTEPSRQPHDASRVTGEEDEKNPQTFKVVKTKTTSDRGCSAIINFTVSMSSRTYDDCKGRVFQSKSVVFDRKSVTVGPGVLIILWLRSLRQIWEQNRKWRTTRAARESGVLVSACREMRKEKR